jgi:hypothetical protein
MEAFSNLLLAHLLSDFPLQTNRIFKMKMEGHKGLLVHTAVHLVVTAVLIQQFWHYWPMFLFLGITHYLTDWVKVSIKTQRQTPGFLLDQLAHLIVLLLIAWWWPEITGVLPQWFVWFGILLTLILALLTGIWVVSFDLCTEPETTTSSACWVKSHLLQYTQQMGWVVVALLSLGSAFLLAMA